MTEILSANRMPSGRAGVHAGGSDSTNVFKGISPHLNGHLGLSRWAQVVNVAFQSRHHFRYRLSVAFPKYP